MHCGPYVAEEQIASVRQFREISKLTEFTLELLFPSLCISGPEADPGI